MVKRNIYIVSDLHLGGAPPEDSPHRETIGFQMCPPKARRRLARFIHHLCTAHPGETTELVINGDFVDFLAEKSVAKQQEFDAFTWHPTQAVTKFHCIVKHTDDNAPFSERVFGALREFVRQGHTLTILLGNHDIELSLPAVRHALMDLLTEGRPARIEFLYDGEALQRENLLIEHGNRYDGWNAIAYGVLRAYRSLLSRNEPLRLHFSPPPGSRLVTEIMNPLKEHFKFIDLLKPENEAMIPVLMALDPSVFWSLSNIVSLLWFRSEKMLLQPAVGEIPKHIDQIADDLSDATAMGNDVKFDPLVYGDTIRLKTIDRSRKLLAQAKTNWCSELKGENTGTLMPLADDQPSRRQRLLGLLAMVKRLVPWSDATLAKLRQAILSYRLTLGTTFELDTESPTYLEAARRLARGRRMVVFGHTHLPKRKLLNPAGLYLNSGTWCPTIRFPTDFYDPQQPDTVVLPKLKQFIEDLANNRTDVWCKLQTTFVQVTQDGERSTGELFEFCEDGSIKPCGA